MPTPPDLNHHATNYVWNAIANTIPDALALLALIIGATVAYVMVTRGPTDALFTIGRWPGTARARNIAAGVITFSFLQSFVWLWVVDHFMYQYDYPGSWCWTCNPVLDALGETTENVLGMIALGTGVGIASGTIVVLSRGLRGAPNA